MPHGGKMAMFKSELQPISLFPLSIFEDHYEPMGFYISDIFQPAVDVLLLTLEWSHFWFLQAGPRAFGQKPHHL